MNITYDKATNCSSENSINFNIYNETASKLMESLALYDKIIVPTVDCSKSVPHQTNNYDCGVFVIKYFQMIVNENPKSTSNCIRTKFAQQFSTNYFTDNDIDIDDIDEIKQALDLIYTELSEINSHIRQAKEELEDEDT